jgi:hypothetical protein
VAHAVIALGVALAVTFAWWRFQFFHRNPERRAPPGADPLCPADGRIMYVEFVYAALRRPLPLGRRDYTEKNEFLGVSIEGDGLRILLVLMADWWIDQIITLVEDGAVRAGEMSIAVRRAATILC